MTEAASPLIVYTLQHPWIKELVAEIHQEVAPNMRLQFLDPADDAAVEKTLPETNFMVTLAVPAEWVPLLEQCRLIMCNGVGYDKIPVQALNEAGIPVAVSPQYTATGVSEHAIMLMLAIYRRLIPVHQSLAAGEFDMFGWRAQCHSLFGRTIGIVGLGRIGKRVAHLAHAFGAKVIYTDIVQPPVELVANLNLEAVSLNELIRRADAITLHVPLTNLTRNMFAAKQFGAMKKGAIFVNTSRGNTYDMDALYEAVESGHLHGAAVDVYQPEPPVPDHPIRRHPHIICTPHMASGTRDRHRAIAVGQFQNCHRVWNGDPPMNEVAPY